MSCLQTNPCCLLRPPQAPSVPGLLTWTSATFCTAMRCTAVLCQQGAAVFSTSRRRNLWWKVLWSCRRKTPDDKLLIVCCFSSAGAEEEGENVQLIGFRDCEFKNTTFERDFCKYIWQRKRVFISRCQGQTRPYIRLWSRRASRWLTADTAWEMSAGKSTPHTFFQKERRLIIVKVWNTACLHCNCSNFVMNSRKRVFTQKEK